MFAGLFVAIVHQPANAQTPDPVHWSASVRPAAVVAGDTVSLLVAVAIDKGFHVYGLKQLDDGPSPLVVRAVDNEFVKANGSLRAPSAEKITKSSFGVPVEWYTTRATFAVPVRIAPTAAQTTTARVSVRYQACSNTVCLLPQTIELTQVIALRTRTTN